MDSARYDARFDADRLPAWRRERVAEAEILDGIPAVDAERNLEDMARINRWFGGFTLLRAAIRRVAGRQPSLRILDVAAGSGATSRWLETVFPDAKVTASDLRGDLLALGTGVRCAADAVVLPFADCSFDVVVSTLFLHHLDEPGLAKAIAEMVRVSRRGVVAVDLARHPFAYWFLPCTRRVFGWDWITVVDGARSVQAAFTRRELEGLLAGAGFPQARVRTHHPWFRLSVSISKAGHGSSGPDAADQRAPAGSVLSSGL